MAPTKQNAEEVVDVAAALAADEGDKCLYLFKASVFDGNTTYVSWYAYCLTDELAAKYADDITKVDRGAISPEIVKCNCGK